MDTVQVLLVVLLILQKQASWNECHTDLESSFGRSGTMENVQKKRLEQQQLMLQIEERKSQLSLNLQSF